MPHALRIRSSSFTPLAVSVFGTFAGVGGRTGIGVFGPDDVAPVTPPPGVFGVGFASSPHATAANETNAASARTFEQEHAMGTSLFRPRRGKPRTCRHLRVKNRTCPRLIPHRRGAS